MRVAVDKFKNTQRLNTAAVDLRASRTSSSVLSLGSDKNLIMDSFGTVKR